MRLPAAITPPPNMPPEFGSGGADLSAASAPGNLSISARTLSAGPSFIRNCKMMPTAVAATARSTPTLATRRPINSSMAPHTTPLARLLKYILAGNVVEHKHRGGPGRRRQSAWESNHQVRLPLEHRLIADRAGSLSVRSQSARQT